MTSPPGAGASGANRERAAHTHAAFVRYTLAAASVAAAFALGWPIHDVAGEQMPFVIFAAAIAFSTRQGRWPAGLFATVLSAVAIKTWLATPAGLLTWDLASALAFAGYLGTGAIIVATMQAVHAANDRLRAQVAESRRTDETLRQRKEQLASNRGALRDNEALLSAVLRQLPVGLGVMGLDGAWIVCNAIMREMAPQGIASALPERAKRWHAFDPESRPIPPRDWPGPRALRGETVSPGIEMLFTGDDGRERWMRVSSAPLRDSAGQIIGATAVVQDIDQIKRAQDALHQSQTRLQGIIASAMDAVITIDSRQHIVLFNPAAEAMFGLSAGEALGKDIAQLIPERFRGPHRNFVEGFGKTGVSNRRMGALGAISGRRANGEEFPVEASISQTQIGDERLYTVILRDITERKRTEERVGRLAAIVDNSRDAIVGQTLDGIVTSWNVGAEMLFGYAGAEMIGSSIRGIVPPECNEEEDEILARLRTGEATHYEAVRLKKNGERIPVSITCSPVKDAAGKIIGGATIARDISERIRSETALREAKNRAEAANRAKDDFLAALSHELRNPLTPVLMTAAELAEASSSLPDDVRKQMEMIHRNIQLEARLIDDLLDLTRITRGRLEFQLETVDVHELLKQTEQITRADLAGRSLNVQLRLDAPRHHVLADKARLQQVFWNLLKNAIKFTPDGGSITVATYENTDARLCTQIQDTGRGIPAEALPRIFKPFDQGDLAGRHAFGGLGLGLSISKAIIDGLGGQIGARSPGEPGSGATFWVELELVASPAATMPEGIGSAGTGRMRLLVIDDHLSTRDTLARLLRRDGHEVQVAGSIAEALKMAGEQTFDLILSDLGLPDGSGLDLMREIKRHYGWPGIALSGYGMPTDQSQTAAAGFSAHLVKPVDMRRVRQTIAEVMTRATEQQDSAGGFAPERVV